MTRSVTEQAGAQPHGTVTHDPTISVEGNRILFTGFQPQWDWEHFRSEPFSLRRPTASLAPQKAISTTMPRSSPSPHLFLSRLCKQVSIPSGRCTCGSQSRHPLAAAVSSRVWGALFPASMQWFRETCAVLHWVMVGSRQAQSQESGFSARPSEKQKSATQHSWSQFSSKHLPRICAWLGRCLQLRQLCRRLLQSGLLQAGLLPPPPPDLVVHSRVSLTHSDLFSSWGTLSSTPDFFSSRGTLSSTLSACPHLNAGPRTACMTSYPAPPMMI